MICSPTGNPSDTWPAGTEHAGFQHKLATIVNGTFMAPAAPAPKRSAMSSPAMVAGGGPSAAKAGTAAWWG